MTRPADVTVGIPTRNRSALLARAIESVLQQTHRDFTVLISDNASDDDTAEVVDSFNDPRIDYRPVEHNIGRPANTNRLIELASTEFLVLLADDDALRPDHLSASVEALRRFPTAGFSHTGCVVIDGAGRTLLEHDRLIDTRRPIVFETGAQYLERCMTTEWTTNFSSATWRKAALVEAGGLRLEDGSIDDLPLMMRIAARWDVAYINRPLSVKTAHDGASSHVNGGFTNEGWQPSADLPDILYNYRRDFLTEGAVPDDLARRLGRMARMTQLSMRGWLGADSAALFRELRGDLRRDPGLGLEPTMWRFAVAQLGGRRMRARTGGAVETARRVLHGRRVERSAGAGRP